ncbi:MAG: hypothetical protein ACFCU3_10305 [Verrucomicrobiales bacterium]
MKSTRSKRKVAAPPRQAIQGELSLPHEGRYFDLKDIFDRLNQRFFRNALRRYTITWGRKRKLRPKRFFVFGAIYEDERIIRIHPLLDAPFVPLWYLEFVVYHEMLHAVVPDEPMPGGRRRIHTEEFLRRERQFPHYRKARVWEEENLGRFLR